MYNSNVIVFVFAEHRSYSCSSRTQDRNLTACFLSNHTNRWSSLQSLGIWLINRVIYIAPTKICVYGRSQVLSHMLEYNESIWNISDAYLTRTRWFAAIQRKWCCNSLDARFKSCLHWASLALCSLMSARSCSSVCFFSLCNHQFLHADGAKPIPQMRLNL